MLSLSLYQRVQLYDSSWIGAQVRPGFPQLPRCSLSDTEPNSLSVLWLPGWRAELPCHFIPAAESQHLREVAEGGVNPVTLEMIDMSERSSLCRTFPWDMFNFLLCNDYLMAWATLLRFFWDDKRRAKSWPQLPPQRCWNQDSPLYLTELACSAGITHLSMS